MESSKVVFTGLLGEVLAARLEMPETDPLAFAIFAHCFTCGKDSLAAVRLSRALASQGIAVLRFDFTGLGGSGGDFANTNFSSNVADLIAAAAFLRTQYRAPALLVGHSLGGTATLAAAESVPESVAVVTIGAPCDATHVEQTFAAAVPAIEADGESTATLGGRKLTIRRSFLDDLREQRQREKIATLGRALLVLHAPKDAVVGIENAARIFAAAKHPKSFISLDTADHLLSRADDTDYAAGVIAAWTSRYLRVAPAQRL
jgi:alpha/beta superfamily hydrolase